MPELESWLAESSARLQPAGRPLVTLTYAQSLDGSIAFSRVPAGVHSSRPLELSGAESKRMTQWLRTQHDAILVGIGTVLADDPQLTVRDVKGPSPRPVIVDTHLRTPPSARVLQAPQKPLIASLKSGARSARARILAQAGAAILPVAQDRQGNVGLEELLLALSEHGLRSVMVEGGARIITAFMKQGLVDRLIVTIAPVVAGGLHAVESLFAEPLPRLKGPACMQYGQDVVIWGEL